MNELVVARYKENIDWIPIDTTWKVTVYNKHEGSNLLPNVGRESHTYFHHIVSNYDNLADWTIFTQGSPIEHPGHNGKNALESILKLITSNVVPFESGFIPLVQVCYPISTYINPLEVIKLASTIHISVHDVKEYFFPNGIFAVSKDVILKHSKDFYQQCLLLVSSSVNPLEGFAFERLWTTIFQSTPILTNNNFKILSAKFGHDKTWIDTTDQIQYMCSLDSGMCVKNIGWGSMDPLPGVVKKTVIEYSKNGNIFKVDVNDNEIATINGIENMTLKPLSYYVNLIREAPIDELMDNEKLEKLICRCGLSNDGYMMRELLPEYLQYTGYGLHIQQNPKEFSEYLLKISELSINKYMEIGVRFAGTFIFTTEYLSRISGVVNSVAIDLAKQTIHDEYSLINSHCQFLYMDSTSDSFLSYVSDKEFDLVLIDGDHSYRGVSSDYNTTHYLSKFCSFHDIANISCPDVSVFWNNIKKHSDEYWEFTHNTHLNDNYQSHFGLGLLRLTDQSDRSAVVK